MFRNQSDVVIGKAKAREKAKRIPKSPSPSPSPSASPKSPSSASASGSSSMAYPIKEIDLLEYDPTTPENKLAISKLYHDNQGALVRSTMPTFSMFPTVDQCAQGYFISTSPLWLRNFDLVDSLCSQTDTDEHLLACISAVGLASLSHQIRSPALMTKARKDYVNALQLTNATLRSPTDAKKDSTLFSVLILSVFEMVTGSNERSIGAWTEHVNGSAALVKIRGPDQFKTAAGQRMFHQVVSNLMLSCVQRTLPMPYHIIQLRKEVPKFIDQESIGWKLSAVIIDFTFFRAAVREVTLVGPKAIVEAGLEIDRRFNEVFSNTPDAWKYSTVYTDEYPDLIWNGNYHLYSDCWMAQLWNGMRTCRILLHETIRDQLLSASLAMTPIFPEGEIAAQTEHSVEIMLQLQADILASVPQHTLATANQSLSTLLEGSMGYFVLWPLYMAGVMDLTTEPIREWVINRLRSIGETVGIRQAVVLADFIKQRHYPEAWDTKPTPNITIPLRKGSLDTWMEATNGFGAE
jgi:hypothetical protein